MTNQTIADSAIYQHTVAQAEKYKEQRDELLNALKEADGFMVNVKSNDGTVSGYNARCAH